MIRDTTIALVRNASSEDAALLCRGMETTLRHVGLASVLFKEKDVETGALDRFRLALLPCHPNPTPPALKGLQDFVRRGGKLLLGINAAPELLGLLGLHRLRSKPYAVREMVFTHKALHGLPPRVFLSTRQIALFKVEDNVKALAQWRTLEDLTANDPAAYLAPNGALLTTAIASAGEHTQFAEDRLHLARLVAALANHFLTGFDLLRFQRQLTEQLNEEEERVRNARPRDFEVRAIWLPQIPTPNEVALAARQNFNLICPHLGPMAAREYERTTFHRPWPLANALVQCVDQAHRNGLEVFPYLTAWPLPSDDIQRFFDGTGRVLKSTEGPASPPPHSPGQSVWMCPTHPDNQQLLIGAITRVLDEFGVDGVVLAGLRFPDETSCGCDGCRARFVERTERKIGTRPMNLPQQRVVWQNWRHEVLTELLGRVLTACRATNPNAKLAVATLPGWDQIPHRFGQDPALWAQQHLADIIIPLDFTEQADVVRDELDHQLRATAGGTRVCPALGLYTPTSEIPSAAKLIQQVEVARELETDGFLLWHSVPRMFAELFGEALCTGLLRSPAKLPWHPNAPSRPPPETGTVPTKTRRRCAVTPFAEC